MKIAFILPCSGRYPIGGFRIVYEYANRLAQAGHNVTLFHSTNIDFRHAPPKRKIITLLLFARNKIFGLYKPRAWFVLDNRIKTVCLVSTKRSYLRSFDAAVATAWQTAKPVANSSALRKYYFIQHFEDWDDDANAVIASWKLPITKIAISKWLKRLIETHGETCRVVPNAIDTDFFYPTSPIEAREPCSVLLQLHSKDWKGSADALAAIEILRRGGEKIELRLFGLPDDKDFVVEGPYTYVRNPSQEVLRGLYGQAAIFVAASWSEGWGLTPHEACACGAAVAATDIDGHREFLEPEKSALLSSPKDPEALAKNIQRLLRDNELRIRLAHEGCEAARRFTWKQAATQFEQFLTGC